MFVLYTVVLVVKQMIASIETTTVITLETARNWVLRCSWKFFKKVSAIGKGDNEDMFTFVFLHLRFISSVIKWSQ